MNPDCLAQSPHLATLSLSLLLCEMGLTIITSLGLGRGTCNRHCPYSPPAAAETTRKGGQSEEHMVICRDVDEPRIRHVE